MLENITEGKLAEDELRTERQRFQTLTEHAPFGMVIIDQEGTFKYINPKFREFFGYDLKDIPNGREWFRKSYPDPAYRHHIISVWIDDLKSFNTGEKKPRIFTVTCKGGTQKIIRFIPVALETGENLVTCEDITEPRQRERDLEAIVAMTTILRTAPTLTDLLPTLLNQILNLLRAEGVALAVRNATSGEILVEWANGSWSSWTGKRLPPGKGITGQVMKTSQLYLNNDMESDVLFEWHDLIGGLRAGVCIPLIAQEQTVGALWVGRKTSVDHSEERLLTAVGDLSANALCRVIVHEQTQKHLQHLTALRTIDMIINANLDLGRVFDVFLEQIITQLHVDAAAILQLNTSTWMLEYAAGSGFHTQAIQERRLRLGESHAGRAALECCLVSTRDPSGGQDACAGDQLLADETFLSCYAAPVISKGQVKGVLEIFHRAPLSPDLEWLEFLETAAGQLAIAIDNAELFNNLRLTNAELTLTYDAMLEGWSRALDLRDEQTEGHTQRVTEITFQLARAMEVSEAEMVNVRRGALLHDIGKMGIPDSILFKPGPLTAKEWEIMRRHPVIAYELLLPISYLRPALDIPYCHHEKWNGMGYPRGLKGEEIPLAARIFTVVDIWDALRSDRPYRPAWSEVKALDYLRSMSGRHFDPRVVDTFLKTEIWKTNQIVQLNSGLEGDEGFDEDRISGPLYPRTPQGWIEGFSRR
jgi:PAS domain S-box-containing protein